MTSPLSHIRHPIHISASLLCDLVPAGSITSISDSDSPIFTQPAFLLILQKLSISQPRHFNPEDSESVTLWNAGAYARLYTASKPGTTSSPSPQWEPRIAFSNIKIPFYINLPIIIILSSVMSPPKLHTV
jgi:hypothetical protein